MNQPVLREAAVTKYAFEEVYFSKDSIDGNSLRFAYVAYGTPRRSLQPPFKTK